ncbi:MAG: carbohydrate ABC transporter permease [Bacilli bacterium]|nr:carbohydrate ABC transporter permease [Bacilli bacterium]
MRYTQKRPIHNKIKAPRANLAFYVCGFIIITIFALVCLVPFLYIISGSLTEEDAIVNDGFHLVPTKFSLNAYKYISASKEQVLHAYVVTIGVTVVGTISALIVMSMGAYVLYRKDFRYRNTFAFMFYFTTLFSGGLIPWYIMIVGVLGWKDSYLALIVPSLCSSWNLLLLRNFMRSIPDSIVESALIDGANDFRIYRQLILPLATPGLATIGLFVALGYWNDWFNANLFLTKQKMFPLQYFLYKLLANAQFLNSPTGSYVAAYVESPPDHSLKMAMACVATGPIILLYPFLQKYFVKGLVLGAVKG